ncbi:MAG TPA: acyl-CoA dehydrogenase family protein [Streptosporangiaceae bacterium]|nr:acyl-CoA dehydrogenase family protein [Streptosporangiaceae bacterium]
MDFTPGESQQAVAGLAAEVLTAADPWMQLAKAGLLSLGVMDTAVLLTEIGRRTPWIAMKALATLMTGALPVDRWGSDQLKEELLPAVSSGEMVLTAAIREAPWANEASRILVPADDGVALVDPTDIAMTPIPTSSGYPAFILHMDDVQPRAMLGGPECARDLEHLAVAGACALIDGAVAGALALTRDHVATRRQFGRPLAEFQAVSQQIADVYIASRTMHLATLSACWRLEEGRDPGADLSVAGYWCAEQASQAVRHCHHLHGGLGMDVTYPLHRFSALVTDLTRYLGGAEYQLEHQCSST